MIILRCRRQALEATNRLPGKRLKPEQLIRFQTALPGG
jgi:hypothetical protein